MAGSTSGISPSFLGLSRSSGQVTHVLLTRSRLCPRPKPGSSLHLHVLSTPPAFVLSQDQTLREELLSRMSSSGAPHEGAAVHRGRRRAPDRVLLHYSAVSLAGHRREAVVGSGTVEPGHTPALGPDVFALLSFQRPSCSSGRGTPAKHSTRIGRGQPV